MSFGGFGNQSGSLFGGTNPTTGTQPAQTTPGTGTSSFGNPTPTLPAIGGSLFGNSGTSTTTPATGGSGIFGSGTNTAQQGSTTGMGTGLFGKPATASNGGSIFGGAGATTGTGTTTGLGTTGGSLFATTQSTTQPLSLFGQPAAQSTATQPTTTSLFGPPSQTQKPASSLFGSTTPSTTQPAQTTGTGTGLFGGGSGLFGGAGTATGMGTGTGTGAGTTGGSLFGSTPSTAQPSIFGQPAAQTTSTAAQPTTSLFGQTAPSTAQPTTSFFGQSTTSTAQPTTSLFGQPATSTTQPTTSLFGSTTSTAQPSTSLFGSTTGTTQPATSLFGGSTTGTMQPTGSLFGGSATSATQPTTSLFGQPATSTTQPTNSLFGQSTTQPTTSLFGHPSQAPKPSGSLFGSTAQPSITQSTLGSTAQQQDPQSQFVALTQRIEGIAEAWNPNSPQCRFQHYFYNLVDPSQVSQYGRPSNATNEALWQRALVENPDRSCMVPVLAVGFDALNTRVYAQTAQATAQQEKLKELKRRLLALTAAHTDTTLSQINRALSQHTQISQRLLKLIQHLHLLIPAVRSSSIRPEEEALRVALEEMEEDLRRPGGMSKMRSKLNELWALVGAVNAARERGRKAGGEGAVEWTVVDEEGLKQITQILADQQAGLQHLTKMLQGDLKDLGVIMGTNGEGEDGGHASVDTRFSASPSPLHSSTSMLRASALR